MSRALAILASIASVTAVSAVGWRWFGRHSNTQVHRINQ